MILDARHSSQLSARKPSHRKFARIERSHRQPNGQRCGRDQDSLGSPFLSRLGTACSEIGQVRQYFSCDDLPGAVLGALAGGQQAMYADAELVAGPDHPAVA